MPVEVKEIIEFFRSSKRGVIGTYEQGVSEESDDKVVQTLETAKS